jgi:Rox3 mediator complex subunit
MQFQPGDVKNAPMWNKLLGHDQPKVEPAQPIQPAAPVRANGPGRPSAMKSQLQHEPIRPRRQGKRRRYDDNSFEGYADGYVDEDMSEDDEERGSARKKIRRPEYDEY